MKVAVVLNSPLLEAFSLIGVDYIVDIEKEDIEKLEFDDVGMFVVPQDREKDFTKKYPEKIVVGI